MFVLQHMLVDQDHGVRKRLWRSGWSAIPREGSVQWSGCPRGAPAGPKGSIQIFGENQRTPLCPGMATRIVQAGFWEVWKGRVVESEATFLGVRQNSQTWDTHYTIRVLVQSERRNPTMFLERLVLKFTQ